MKLVLRGVSIGVLTIIVLAIFDRRPRVGEMTEPAKVDRITAAELSRYVSNAPAYETLPLNRAIDSFEIKNATMREALERFAKEFNASLIVNLNAFAEAGVDVDDRRINCLLQNTNGNAALHAILSGANVDSTKVDYTENELGQVVIDEWGKVNSVLYERLYDARQLIHQFAASPSTEVGAPTRVFDESQSTDELIRLIEEQIAADSWKDNGGNIGSIRALGGMLIITQTPQNHRACEVFLDRLRKQYR